MILSCNQVVESQNASVKKIENCCIQEKLKRSERQESKRTALRLNGEPYYPKYIREDLTNVAKQSGLELFF